MKLEDQMVEPGVDEQDFGFDYQAIYIRENIRYYRGNSMRGTFQLGDRLLIEPALFGDITPGDIVLYQRTDALGNTEELVHRVVALVGGKLITRGDQNKWPDIYPVQTGQIIGKVIATESGGYEQVVLGGIKGLQRAKRGWVKLRWNYFVYRLSLYPYRIIQKSRIISRYWRPALQKLHLNTDRGPLVKYIYKQKTIAIWESYSKQLICRRPFDLVIFPPEDT
jgi:signal peptidase I